MGDIWSLSLTNIKIMFISQCFKLIKCRFFKLLFCTIQWVLYGTRTLSKGNLFCFWVYGCGRGWVGGSVCATSQLFTTGLLFLSKRELLEVKHLQQISDRSSDSLAAEGRAPTGLIKGLGSAANDAFLQTFAYALLLIGLFCSCEP